MAAVGLLPAAAPAQTIDPSPIFVPADNGVPGTGLDVSVAAGGDGSFAFRASSSSGHSGVCSRTSNHSIITIVGDNFGATQSLRCGPTGEVVFSQDGPPGQMGSLYTYSPGGTLLTIQGSNFGISSFTATGIFSDGSSRSTTFLGTTPGGSVGLYRSSLSGGALITIVGDFLTRSISNPSSPSGSDDGLGTERCVFTGSSSATGEAGVYSTTHQGTIITIRGSDFGGSAFSSVRSPGLSGSTVLFAATNSAGNARLLSMSIDTSATAASPLFAPGTSVGDIALSSTGLAWSLMSATGDVLSIQTGDRSLSNLAPHPIISLGDSLGGSTVTRLLFSSQGLNDQGQLAFFAELADGSSGFYMATGVPAPGAAALLAIGSAGLLDRRRRRGQHA
jgi:hypothetical protein